MNLFYRMNFYTQRIFYKRIKVLKWDTNIYFKSITLFEKKKKIVLRKFFCKKKFDFLIQQKRCYQEQLDHGQSTTANLTY